MNVLIIFAHPEPKSFNGAMKDVAVQTLQKAGHSVQVSDLYTMRFDAVGDERDFVETKGKPFFNYLDEQVRATNESLFIPELKQEMDKLIWADLVIFQVPLWWFSLPAVKKGWIDRVFAMGFAYDVKRNFQNGVFSGKRSMLALTTGSPEMLFRDDAKLGDMGQILHHIQWGMLRYVGMDVMAPFVAFGAARATPEQRTAYLNDYRLRLLAIESTAPIELRAAHSMRAPASS